ncbi:hypothetical protein D3C80_1982330 [compost metagenome]
MSQVEIHAAFDSINAAREAQRKLQALRAFEVSSMSENGTLTATVDEAVAERALHLISQIGGNANTVI